MTTLLVILALMLIFCAFIYGERRGDASGYERGMVNGSIEGRKQAKKELAQQQKTVEDLFDKLDADTAAHEEQVRKFAQAAKKVVTTPAKKAPRWK